MRAKGSSKTTLQKAFYGFYFPTSTLWWISPKKLLNLQGQPLSCASLKFLELEAFLSCTSRERNGGPRDDMSMAEVKLKVIISSSWARRKAPRVASQYRPIPTRWELRVSQQLKTFGAGLLDSSWFVKTPLFSWLYAPWRFDHNPNL